MSKADAVTIAYVHETKVSHAWHLSLMELVGYDLAHHGRVIQGGWAAVRCNQDGLPVARNKAVAQFLAEDRADWLFWIDADMGFAPDIVDRLLEAADPNGRPIVGALAFAWREHAPDGMGGYRCSPAPTILDWVNTGKQQGFQGRASYPVNSLVRCAGTGSAAVLMHRSVFERIQQAHGPVWYDRVPNPSTGQVISEDLSFCLRAGALGIPVFVHTGVRTTHEKPFWLAEQDFWRHAIAPPATAPVDVIVPVLHRPEQAEPFMGSLRASTGLATVYAVCDRDDADAVAAWRAQGAVIIDVNDHLELNRPGTFAEKANIGYRMSDGPWLLLVGSDVRFHAGWLDHAQAIAGDSSHVVGTNDLGNPRVTSGEHATHLLIRRTYVDDVGASWDGPKNVAHEGYQHWYVDDEIVTAAKQRKVWAMALGSIVEHLHPAWGKGQPDEVYELGATHAEADGKLFTQRLRDHQ